MEKAYRISIWHEDAKGPHEPVHERDYAAEDEAREAFAAAAKRICDDYEHDRAHGRIFYRHLPETRYLESLTMIPLDECGDPVDSMEWDELDEASWGYGESEAKADRDWREEQWSAGYVINRWDDPVKFDACVPLMDDDVREEVHMELAPCTDQEFFDRYCELHLEKFGDDFEPNKANPQW